MQKYVIYTVRERERKNKCCQVIRQFRSVKYRNICNVHECVKVLNVPSQLVLKTPVFLILMGPINMRKSLPVA